ncbi:mitochondrial import receptor subunit Tom22 [Coemansia sp. RSA 376]|nr:mitochondrial import receptor subunit Tom22 [Coemansia sp. S16]KAJ2097378.1 mitochondrial import receptor subunit Tom22 [Coemansia sp. S142-1]KAJ2112357.1 mitochondrial import receptor subunit Tom22 [Coemansia sp. RSA 922]KAJ2261151.1 mitochondrial import receptor subunit Tom22 [Coemansia sp. RSA 376]KAJ2426343.1 mitochondrial import receptor subunit Tom22 [Coemansia sp. RSA 2531]
MVKLVEIEDDAVFDDDSQYTTDEDENESIASLTDKEEEDESDFDFDEEDDEFEETFLERVQALKDIIPIEKRRAFSSAISNISYWGTFGLHLAGKLSWVFTTSALLVVFPLALESDREKMMQQWESEQAGGIPGGQQQPMGGMLPPGVAGSAPGIVA